MIKITLNKIAAHHPCPVGWEKILEAKQHLGMDTEFPLVEAFESNSLDDVLWSLRCVPEFNSLWRKFAVWSARQVEYLMKDQRSRDALDVAWRHSEGLATDEELAAASDAAWGAAIAAVSDAARDAAWGAWDAARDAAWGAWDAARDAAWGARGAARDAAWGARGAARDAQKEKLKQILTVGHWID